MVDIEHHPSLTLYLARRAEVAGCRVRSCQTLAGGVSNKTVLVEFEDRGPVVCKQALPRLRVRDIWECDPARIHREAGALRLLPELTPGGATTPLVFHDPSQHLLAMDAVPQPHDNLKSLLMAGQLDRRALLKVAGQMGSLIGFVRRTSSVLHQSGALPGYLYDQHFFRELRVEPYYLTAARRVPESAVFIQSLVRQAQADVFCFVHGDYSPKNMLIRHGEIVLLDHEVAHIGDGTFDIGFCLTHLLAKSLHLRSRRQDMLSAAAAFIDSTLAESPLAGDQQSRAVRHTLACLLARVAGKSPLEYLSDRQRQCVQEIVLRQMNGPPDTLGELVDSLGTGLLHTELSDNEL